MDSLALDHVCNPLAHKAEGDAIARITPPSTPERGAVMTLRPC